MTTDPLEVSFDAEADFLEFRFSEAAGYEKGSNSESTTREHRAAGCRAGKYSGKEPFRDLVPRGREMPGDIGQDSTECADP